MHGAVTERWGDGPHIFRLGLGELRELEERRGSGTFAVLRRIASRECRVDDLRETIRLGLIGGGMAPLAALALVERYFDARPLEEAIAPALAVLAAAAIGLEGDEDQPPGESMPAESSAG